eukprot:SAG31_NODE_294_length_18242_cov_28.418949_12_plen_103_part_00
MHVSVSPGRCKTREALIACLIDTCADAGNVRVLARLEETDQSFLFGPKWALLEPKFEKEYFHVNILNPKTEERMLKALTEFSVQVFCPCRTLALVATLLVDS